MLQIVLLTMTFDLCPSLTRMIWTFRCSGESLRVPRSDLLALLVGLSSRCTPPELKSFRLADCRAIFVFRQADD